MALAPQQLLDAEVKFRALVAHHPNRSDLFVNWLAVLEALGRAADVLRHFRSRIVGGESEQAVFDAFLAFCQRNSLGERGVRVLMAGLARTPGRKSAWLALSRAQGADWDGEPVRATAVARPLRRALAITPRDTELAHLLGSALQISQQPAAAILAMREAFDAVPSAEGLARTLASCYADLESFSEAADVLLAHIRAGQATQVVAQELFAYLVAAGRFGEAWATLQRPVAAASGVTSLASSSTFLAQWPSIAAYGALKRRIDPANDRHRLMVGTLLSIAKPYRHNIALAKGISTFDVGGIMANSPVENPLFNVLLGDLIFDRLGDITGKRLIDIGGADGYFAIRAAAAGAEVTYMEPDPLFCTRTRAFAELSGVEDRLRIVRQYLQPQHRSLMKRMDICLSLGLIYHFNDLMQNLQYLLPGPGTHVIEVHGRNDLEWRDADAASHRDGEAISLPWLKSYLVRQGFTVEEVPEWAAFAARYPKSRGRELWIARPVQADTPGRPMGGAGVAIPQAATGKVAAQPPLTPRSRRSARMRRPDRPREEG